LILAVHLVIYGLYAVISLIFVWGIATLFFKYQIKGSVLHFLSSYLLVMLSMFSVGMMVGGIAPDMKTASIIASILYFPMLIFSGATLPYEVMPQGLQKIVDILPLTQGIKLLKTASLGLPKEGVMFPIIMMCLLALLCIGISIKFFKWE
jgi:ABC-2 type transport system permease protein